MYIWQVLIIALTIGISVGTGIAGFLVLLIVFAFYACAIGVVYYIYRLRNRETPPSALEAEQKALLQKKSSSDGTVAVAPALTGAHGSSPVHVKGRKSASGADGTPSGLSGLAATPPIGNLASGSDVSDLPPAQRPAFIKDKSIADGTQSSAAGDDYEAGDTIYPYAARPHRMGYVQRRFLGFTAMFFLLAFVLCVALFGIWRVNDYRIIDRSGSPPETPSAVEYIPQTIAKSVESIYAFDGYATKLHLDNMFFSVGQFGGRREKRSIAAADVDVDCAFVFLFFSSILGTEWCGAHYSTELTSDDQKYQSIERDYIEKYQIDMSIFLRPSYLQYSSVNDWFIREIDPAHRPVSPNPLDVTSPSEARVTVWGNNPEGVKFWIKGESFTMEDFLTDAGQPALFKGEHSCC